MNLPAVSFILSAMTTTSIETFVGPDLLPASWLSNKSPALNPKIGSEPQQPSVSSITENYYTRINSLVGPSKWLPPTSKSLGRLFHGQIA